MDEDHGESRADSSALKALRETRLLALDVDGTLTRGAVILDGESELQVFDVHDGQGLVWLREAGVHIVWITGRGSAAVSQRARALKITALRDHVSDKERVLAELQEQLGVEPANTVAMGDDLPDLRLAVRSGTFVAPASARPEVRERADLVTRAPGGAGAVRELCELVLRAQGRWEALVEAASRR